MKVLQQEAKALSGSADKAIDDSERFFTELISMTENQSNEVRAQFRSQQKTGVRLTKELQEKLEPEIADLRRKDTELE